MLICGAIPAEIKRFYIATTVPTENKVNERGKAITITPNEIFKAI